MLGSLDWEKTYEKNNDNNDGYCLLIECL